MIDKVMSELQKGGLCGTVIRAGEKAYDASCVTFYDWFHHRPALIVKAADAADVSRTVCVARDQGLVLAVRSGGHSIAGHSGCDGGIVLDLSAMHAVEVDPIHCTAWADTGATAGHVTLATAAHGLAVGFGDTASVGIGGLTLGGGVGYLSRKYGLTIDSLLAAEVVTADGARLSADAATNPDLFWALRGGGGNFGVATRLKFQLQRVDQVLGGLLVLPVTPEVIEAFIEAVAAAPDELSVIANMIAPAPPMPFLPREHHGRPLIVAMMVYAGAIEEGQRVLASLRKAAPPLADMVRPMRYPEIYGVEGPHPAVASVRSLFIDRLGHEDAAAIAEYLRSTTASMAAVQVRVLGGAMSRVAPDATAFAHRNRKIMVNVAALFQHPEETPAHEARVIGLADTLGRGDQEVYVNFLGLEGPERLRQAYPGPTWNRLREIKRRYDPDNLFRVNKNIPPA
ncbi:MAG TPA: FAD-binding oxidoreductase [Bacteroidota bacterium]